jgi:hypothetical protein
MPNLNKARYKRHYFSFLLFFGASGSKILKKVIKPIKQNLNQPYLVVSKNAEFYAYQIH